MSLYQTKKGFDYNASEREADRVAERFSGERDVVGSMSRAFGTDLSKVKVHTDFNSARKAERENADAFARGSDVFMGEGYAPGTRAGNEMLSHELAHTIQQSPETQGMMQAPAPQGTVQRGWWKKRKEKKRAKKADRELRARMGNIKTLRVAEKGRVLAERKEKYSSPVENEMKDGKRVWGLNTPGLIDPGIVSSVELQELDSKRRESIDDFLSGTGRDMRDEVSDLFESGQRVLAMQGGQPVQGMSAYQAMQAEGSKIRQNTGIAGAQQATDAYNLAGKDLVDRILAIYNTESGGQKTTEPVNMTIPENQEKVQRLALLMIEEVGKELENSRSLLSGIADRHVEILNDTMQFPKMEGGQDLVTRFMLNDMILKAVGAVIARKSDDKMLLQAMNFIMGGSAQLMSNKDTPQAEAVKKIETRYKQSKTKDTKTDTTEPAPTIPTSSTSIKSHEDPIPKTAPITSSTSPITTTTAPAPTVAPTFNMEQYLMNRWKPTQGTTAPKKKYGKPGEHEGMNTLLDEFIL